MPAKTTRRSFLGAAFASSLLLSSGCISPTGRMQRKQADLTELLKDVREKRGLPAIAAGAIKDGVVVASGAVGVRKMGDPTPVTIQDKFHIGSCTKAMTATLAAMLVEQRKLQWTSTLAEVFPERAARMHSHYREVTLESLLTHRSGAANGDNALFVADWLVRRALGGESRLNEDVLMQQRLMCLDALVKDPPAHEAGTFNYSNAGYIMAGAMIERVTGRSWEESMRSRLLKPLKMSSAGFGPPSKHDEVDKPWGHVMRDGKYQPRFGDNPPGLGPAGTVHCTVLDYLKFASLHTSLGSHPRALLSRSTCEHLHEPPPNADYALGWGVAERDWAHGCALTHFGSNTMNFFIVWLAPKIDFALAVASNAGGDELPNALDSIASNLVHRFSLNH